MYPRISRYPAVLLAVLMVLVMIACTSETPVSDNGTNSPVGVTSQDAGTANVAPPSGLVHVSYEGSGLDLWPYLTPDGERMEDPVNMIFVGEAGALQIRAALLALDGDRTAYGFPPVFPFNATWSEAMGGVQAAYSDGEGWLGSVVQLQLGAYSPLRFHLRLYETGEPFGSDGVWTIGGAHFDLLIPGTPEHQVISWELAEKIVMVDLIRSGLLHAAPSATQVINAEPTFRTIPVPIYNGIPDALKIPCELPPGPTDVPVPIPTNGRATILWLGDSAPIVDGASNDAFTIQFQQIIPKPFCATGPADVYMVEGPVDLKKNVQVDGAGRYTYHYQLSGMLTATPVGGGEPFKVNIHDIQSGFIHGDDWMVNAQAKRIAPQDGGSELFMEWLKLGTNGADQFRHKESCLAP
jgi:hypothetical protein